MQMPHFIGFSIPYRLALSVQSHYELSLQAKNRAALCNLHMMLLYMLPHWQLRWQSTLRHTHTHLLRHDATMHGAPVRM